MVALGLLMDVVHQMHTICVSKVTRSVRSKCIEAIGVSGFKVNLLVLKQHHAR